MSISVEETILKIVSRQMGINVRDIKTTSNIVEDLDADSLDTVELVMAVEEHFGFEVDDESAEQITTVQSLIDFVLANTNK